MSSAPGQLLHQVLAQVGTGAIVREFLNDVVVWDRASIFDGDIGPKGAFGLIGGGDGNDGNGVAAAQGIFQRKPGSAVFERLKGGQGVGGALWEDDDEVAMIERREAGGEERCVLRSLPIDRDHPGIPQLQYGDEGRSIYEGPYLA